MRLADHGSAADCGLAGSKVVGRDGGGLGLQSVVDEKLFTGLEFAQSPELENEAASVVVGLRRFAVRRAGTIEMPRGIAAAHCADRDAIGQHKQVGRLIDPRLGLNCLGAVASAVVQNQERASEHRANSKCVQAMQETAASAKQGVGCRRLEASMRATSIGLLMESSYAEVHSQRTNNLEYLRDTRSHARSIDLFKHGALRRC